MKKKLSLKNLKVHSFVTQHQIKGGLEKAIAPIDSGKRDCDTDRWICGTY